jgi:tetratricopeptide (TPR) repeat protein
MIAKVLILTVLISSLLVFPQDSTLTAARKARDRGDTGAMRKLISATEARAAETRKFEDYVRLALLENWMCEALEASNNQNLLKETAEAGVAAAEKAVSLNPKSSQAHQLLADLLGQLAPNVMGGGMKYGQRSTDEADKAIELDPNNSEAYITRGISYLYTPEGFGGNKKKAGEFFTRAVQLAPQTDTAHVWLALYHLDAERFGDALREVTEALRLNPDRAFSKFVAEQIKSGKKSN